MTSRVTKVGWRSKATLPVGNRQTPHARNLQKGLVLSTVDPPYR